MPMTKKTAQNNETSPLRSASLQAPPASLRARVWRLLLVAPVLLSCVHAAAGGAEWLTYRGNNTLDGRTAAKGAITDPKTVWSGFAGVYDAYAIAEPGAGDAKIPCPDNTSTPVSADAADPRWGLTPPPANIEGRDQSLPKTRTTVYADILPDTPGLEKIEFESGFAKPTVNGQYQSCVGRCFAWKDGKWTLVWQTDPFELLFIPLPVVGDFDGDKRPEIAILPWRELVILDAQTGKIKDRCKFTDGRSYGFLGAYDLDGDGHTEFVVQADFCKHINVLGYRDGKLTVLWSEEIETDITNPQKILRVNPNPVADLFGDGKLEVLENLWDGTADGRWHIYVHDGMTGKVLADLPDEYLQGVCDVNGDKVAELLTTATSGAGVPQFGPSRVYSLKGGKVAKLWERADAGWQTWEPPLKPNVNSDATLARQTALCRTANGVTWAALRGAAAHGPITVSLVKWSANGFENTLTAAAPGLLALAIAPDGRLLLRASVIPGSPGEITVTGGRGAYIGAQARDLVPSTPVIAAGPDGKPLIIIQGYDETLLALRPPPVPSDSAGTPAPAPMKRVWEVTGRGQSSEWPIRLGPVVANLNGGADRSLLYATAAPSGCARLVAMDLEAHPLWSHDFPEIPGTAPIWNTGGIIFWQAGHFTNATTQDVLVTVRRSMMHSDETALLSGKDGAQLWRRNRQISQRGVGGTPFAIADFDGDGLDDAASFYPSIFYILKGATGADIVAKDAIWKNGPPNPVYWGKPVAGHFEKPGGPAEVFMAGASMTGLMRADGALVWSDAFEKSAKTFAFGDFNGDGKFEAIGAEFEDGFRCYNTADGAIQWRMPNTMTGALAGVATADIDSDGKDEAIFSSGTTLYCLGVKDGKGIFKWQLPLSATTGPPALADVDGTGKLSIVLLGANGCVYCIR